MDDGIDTFHLDAIADADPYPYWYDDADEPDSNPTLVRTESCDLCIVGGGYTGLWTAIIAKERDPSRDVILIDAHEVGSAASGRNGGFMESSLTHGRGERAGALPGRDRDPRGPRPAEPERHRGRDQAIRHRLRLRAHRRDRRGHHQFHSASYLRRTARRLHPAALASARRSNWLDARRACSRQVNSPTYTGGLWRKDRAAIVDPARLVWGLKSACGCRLGVRIYEDTKATSIEKRRRRRAHQHTARSGARRQGGVGHQRVQAVDEPQARPLHRHRCTTTAWSPSRSRNGPVGRVHRLDCNRQGLSPTSPTSSTTTDSPRTNRILWGGYDAIYFFGAAR